MISSDLAELYEVELRSLTQAVKRNQSRFPDDFVFQLDKTEFEALRSQIVILETPMGRGKYPKYLHLFYKSCARKPTNESRADESRSFG